ncbi:MAG: hypothetical protein D6812_04565 [Deltaproteobacteria bacterium]|nr:MAG: hypothetical protein D6812_04565 [Deltaproteobacteria bacterium]
MKKPHEVEDEYFKRLELERRKLLEEAREKDALERAREERRAQHYMFCPKCGGNLKPVLFREVTIDRCLSCEGVWLDAGELEKVAGKQRTFLDDFIASFTSSEEEEG